MSRRIIGSSDQNGGWQEKSEYPEQFLFSGSY
jgi:hypothetical protein